MDIKEFANGISIPDPESLSRFKTATLGYPYSSYLEQAQNTRLSSRSFEAYYWHLLPKYFTSSTQGFDLHCLLNFAVQQLSVKALHNSSKNHYVYIGDSYDNFAASLLVAPSFLPATWVRKPEGAHDAKNQIKDLLADGKEHDIKEVSIRTEKLTDLLAEIPKESCGLLIVEHVFLQEDLNTLLEKTKEILSLNGTLIFIAPKPHSFSGAINNEFFLCETELSSSTLLILRRTK